MITGVLIYKNGVKVTGLEPGGTELELVRDDPFGKLYGTDKFMVAVTEPDFDGFNAQCDKYVEEKRDA